MDLLVNICVEVFFGCSHPRLIQNCFSSWFLPIVQFFRIVYCDHLVLLSQECTDLCSFRYTYGVNTNGATHKKYFSPKRFRHLFCSFFHFGILPTLPLTVWNAHSRHDWTFIRIHASAAQRWFSHQSDSSVNLSQNAWNGGSHSIRRDFHHENETSLALLSFSQRDARRNRLRCSPGNRGGEWDLLPCILLTSEKSFCSKMFSNASEDHFTFWCWQCWEFCPVIDQCSCGHALWSFISRTPDHKWRIRRTL